MKTLVVFLLVTVSSSWFVAFAQCKDVSASSASDVLERYVLFEDAYKQKKFTEAKGPLNWLLRNAPRLNTNLYIKAVETYSELATLEKNSERKGIYMDSVIIVYDLRIKNCGEEANVIGRKAVSFFNYYYNDSSKANEILFLMDRSIELGGEKILDAIAENYMQGIRLAAGQKLLSDEQILERYDRITAITDLKIENARAQNKPVERYIRMQENNLSILSSIIDMDCDFVRTKIGPQFRANPDDLTLAKRIFSFMLKGKCTDDPLWLEAAEKLHSAEKDFGLAKILGLRYLSLKDEEMSGKRFAEALDLAKTPSDRADILGLQGHLEQMKGNYSKARELYLKAISLDAGKKEFYERIGDLYLNSFEKCKKEKSKAEDRFIYLVAYDMYQRAGETHKMADAKAAFPSREEIHDINYQPGDKIIVTCWINEETTIRTRN